MKQGKKLELVIKQIEQVKLPGATINSPEYVRDCDTETLREVDVGIRYPTPNGEVFIAIECRDRRSVQDIMWIEQLISKKRSIQADILVAITSSSFTEPAKVKAYKNGIVLKNVEAFTSKDILALARAPYIELFSLSKKIFFDSVRVYYYEIQIIEKDLRKCRILNQLTNIYHRISDYFDSLLSLESLTMYSEKIPSDRDYVTAEASAELKDTFLITPSGKRIAISRVGFSLLITRHVNKYPVILFLKYKDNTTCDLLAEMYEYEKVTKFVVDAENKENVLILDMDGWEYKDRQFYSALIKQDETNEINKISLVSNKQPFKAGSKFTLYGQK